MATLNIRDLPDAAHRRLRVRAAEHGGRRAGNPCAQACMTGRKSRATADEATAKAARAQAFVDKLYRGKKPENVIDDCSCKAAKEATE